MTTKTTKTTPSLIHRHGCAEPRGLDRIEHTAEVMTLHCVDCGAHQAFMDGDPVTTPVTSGAFATGSRSILDGITMEIPGGVA